MAIKRNRKDYGFNEKSTPVFVRITDQKTGRNKILGWFPSIANAKRKIYSFLDENNRQIFDSSNYGRAWSMKNAKDVENPLWPFGKQFDPNYYNYCKDNEFYDQHTKI